MTELSIIIVNYRVRDYLHQCLLSVCQAIKGMQAEVIVVDNCSMDGAIEYLSPLFPEVRFIQNTENTGFSKANNLAIEQSSGKYVLLLNPDTFVGEDTFKDVCQFMDNHPEAGGIGTQMLDGKGRFLPESKRGFPDPWTSFCKIFGLSHLFPYSKLFGRYHLKYLNKEKIHVVPILSGAFMAIRRSALNKTGLLDEQFFMYGEDIDLSYRIILSGYENYYLPFPIVHYKGESTKKGSLQYVSVFYGAMALFFKKHYPHYSWIYSCFIQLAIGFRAGISFLKRIIQKSFRFVFPKKEKSRGTLLVLSRNNLHSLETKLQTEGWKQIIYQDQLLDSQILHQIIREKTINDILVDSSCFSYQNILLAMQKTEIPVNWLIYHSNANLIVGGSIIINNL